MNIGIAREWLKVEEVAALTGLSLATIRRRIADGSLPTFQPGGKRTAVRIPSSALNAAAPNSVPANTLPETPAAPIITTTRRRPNWLR